MTIVQESRFQLVDDQGAAHLFLLGPGSPAEPAQLPPLACAQARVRVRYSQAEGLIAFLAHSIERLPVRARAA